jgi:dipeptidyl aminopeptidase/acylaminoacyl peptidase
MLEHGRAESVLVTYPEEGHGVATWPAAIDYLTRAIDWFDTHLLERKP